MSEMNWNDVLVKIKQELPNIVRFIDSTRQGMDNLESTMKISSEKFPEASNQINAVTGALEDAANRIMTILEESTEDQARAAGLISELASFAATLPVDKSQKALEMIKSLEAINTKMKTDTMEIFTNMSFHDLSGQKLKKVMSTLRVVEERLIALTRSFGLSELELAGKGPVEKEKAVSQDTVDELLKELGKN